MLAILFIHMVLAVEGLLWRMARVSSDVLVWLLGATSAWLLAAVLDQPGNGSDWLFDGQPYLWIGLPIVLGAVVHTLGDALTISGCPLRTEIRDDVATREQVDRLRTDIRTAVDDDRPVVANILGGARDVDGVEHSYPGHYVTVVRYEGDGDRVLIADPARPDVPTYWMDVTELANWIAGRGYSS